MNMMKNIGKHKNIVNLIGCCTQNGKTISNLVLQLEILPHTHKDSDTLCNHIVDALLMVLYTFSKHCIRVQALF